MSKDMDIELSRVRGNLDEGRTFIRISSDKVLNVLQFLVKILIVSLIVCFFEVYRVMIYWILPQGSPSALCSQ